MTPEQWQAIHAAVQLIQFLSSKSALLSLACMMLAPWMVLVVISVGQVRRFDRVVKMYEDNVVLVRSFEKMAKNQQDLIMYNTQVMTGVQKMAENNLFCPLNRKHIKPRDIEA